MNKKRTILLILILAAVVVGIIWGAKKFGNKEKVNNPENQLQVYEALVNVVDQKSSDASANLEKGDVISYFPEGHLWSDTEKNSYLIIKIKLSPEDAIKLTEAEKISKAESSEKDGKNNSLPDEEIIRARKYHLNLPDFDLQKFWGGEGQPFEGKTFDREMIQKK